MQRSRRRFAQHSWDENGINRFSCCSSLQAVQKRSEKIAEEEERCKKLAEAAQQDLDEAIPALEEATKVLLRPRSFFCTPS